MTAIPDATEEDKTVLLKIEQAYEEIEDQIRAYDHYCDGDKIADWKYEQRLIRLLSHYQRENERLKTELKSTLADTERIDWLESQVERNEPAVDWSPEFSMDKGKSLREEIDRRRVQA